MDFNILNVLPLLLFRMLQSKWVIKVPDDEYCNQFQTWWSVTAFFSSPFHSGNPTMYLSFFFLPFHKLFHLLIVNELRSVHVTFISNYLPFNPSFYLYQFLLVLSCVCNKLLPLVFRFLVFFFAHFCSIASTVLYRCFYGLFHIRAAYILLNNIK